MSDRSSPDRLAYRLRELSDRAGVGLTTLYGEIKSGRLRTCKLGRVTLVLAEDADAWLASLPQGVDREPVGSVWATNQGRRDGRCAVE